MVEKCIYCGEIATTRDHVPPKSFFLKPVPSDLITVPACFKCNNGLSMDEDYLRTIVSSAWEEDGSTPLAETIFHQKVAKSLLRNPPLLHRIYDSFQLVEVHSGKIYLGKKIAYEMDMARVRKVISKIVKGLFYHHNGQPLDPTFNVKVLLNPKNLDPDFVNSLVSNPIEEIGSGIFRYRKVFVNENPNYSAWVMSFYQNDYVNFVCITGKVRGHGV